MVTPDGFPILTRTGLSSRSPTLAVGLGHGCDEVGQSTADTDGQGRSARHWRASHRCFRIQHNQNEYETRPDDRPLGSAALLSAGCWQTDVNQSLFAQVRPPSGRAKTAPLSQCGGTVQLEVGAAAEVSFGVEQAVDRGMDGGAPLLTSDAPKPQHRRFPPSEAKAGILRAIVRPPAGLLAVRNSDRTKRRAIGSQPV